MNNLKELKKEIARQTKERQKEIALAIAIKKLKMQEEYIKSERYEKRIELENDLKKLDIVLNYIEEMYSEYNRTISFVYGYGVVCNKLLTIAKAIYYSSHTDKEELLALTNSTEILIEELVEAFGNTAYYSPMQGEIVEEVPMNIEKVKELLEEFAINVGLTSKLDLSKFEKDRVEKTYQIAKIKALDLMENSLKYEDEE